MFGLWTVLYFLLRQSGEIQNSSLSHWRMLWGQFGDAPLLLLALPASEGSGAVFGGDVRAVQFVAGSGAVVCFVT